MKLCDRCPLAGTCLLDYLGKACRNARKQDCPDIIPTVAETFHNMDTEQLARAFADYAAKEGAAHIIGMRVRPIKEWLELEVREPE